MNRWIFQGNQDTFDVTKYLTSSDFVYWSVKHKSHQKKITIGDLVFIWRARGRSKLMPGIIAFGTIVEECKTKSQVSYPEYLAESLWSEMSSEISDIKAGVRIHEVRPTPGEGMLSYYQIRTIPELSGMQIVTVRTGTNFLLTESQFSRLFEIWDPLFSDLDVDFPSYSSDYSSKEAFIRYRLHRTRDRDRKIVTLAKKQFLENHESLFCELCNFDFSEVYGQYGEGFIEAHHIKPLEKMSEGEETSVSDLMLVCSNCHRIIHRGDYIENLYYLKELFSNTRVGILPNHKMINK